MKKIVLLMLLVCMAGSCQGAQTDGRPAGEPYKWPDDAQDMKLGIGIWFYSPERADKVFKDDYLTAEQPFNEQFLDDLRPFKVIRFTDWNKIQFNDTSKWEQRPKKDVLPDKQAGAVAYEWMIQICNTLGADFWMNAPHMADDEYMHKLVQLIHDTLDPKLKCYVEYSNETWNSAFGNEGQFAEGHRPGSIHGASIMVNAWDSVIMILRPERFTMFMRPAICSRRSRTCTAMKWTSAW